MEEDYIELIFDNKGLTPEEVKESIELFGMNVKRTLCKIDHHSRFGRFLEYLHCIKPRYASVVVERPQGLVQVVRSGRIMNLIEADLVVGDLLVLSPKSNVPADCFIVSGTYSSGKEMDLYSMPNHLRVYLHNTVSADGVILAIITRLPNENSREA